jgi:hypothetical protein
MWARLTSWFRWCGSSSLGSGGAGQAVCAVVIMGKPNLSFSFFRLGRGSGDNYGWSSYPLFFHYSVCGGKMMVVIGRPESNLSFSLFWLCGSGDSDGGSPDLWFLYLGLMVRRLWWWVGWPFIFLHSGRAGQVIVMWGPPDLSFSFFQVVRVMW